MKSTVLLHFVLLMVLQLAAQPKTVNIHGIVKDTTIKSIEITHVTDSNLTKFEEKKLNVVNGMFNVSIQIPFPTEIVISHGNRLFRESFIYSDAEILIDSTGKPHIIGSPVQDEYEKEFLPFFQLNDDFYDTIVSFFQKNRQKYGDNFPKSVQDSANLLKEKYGYQRTALLEEYIKQHPDSYVALWNIYYFISMGSLNQYFDFEKLFSSFSDQMQHQSFINELKARLKKSGRMQVGMEFPHDFFKGYAQMHSKVRKNCQYYLIDFWYSHCGPCIAHFPELKKIYHQFHSKGFDIISISVDRQKDLKDYTVAIKRNGLIWNHIWDKEGVKAKEFNVNTFPTYILLDKYGRIINLNIEPNQLETFLKEHL